MKQTKSESNCFRDWTTLEKKGCSKDCTSEASTDRKHDSPWFRVGTSLDNTSISWSKRSFKKWLLRTYLGTFLINNIDVTFRRIRRWWLKHSIFHNIIWAKRTYPTHSRSIHQLASWMGWPSFRIRTITRKNRIMFRNPAARTESSVICDKCYQKNH